MNTLYLMLHIATNAGMKLMFSESSFSNQVLDFPTGANGSIPCIDWFSNSLINRIVYSEQRRSFLCIAAGYALELTLVRIVVFRQMQKKTKVQLSIQYVFSRIAKINIGRSSVCSFPRDFAR